MTFNMTVVSLTNGDARIVASNVASGAWAEYTVRPTYAPPTFAADLRVVGGDLVFSVPTGYTLFAVEGADAVVGDAWNWDTLSLGTDYTVSAGVVTLLTGGADYQMIRIYMTPD